MFLLVLPAWRFAFAAPQCDERDFCGNSQPHRKTGPEAGTVGDVERHAVDVVPATHQSPVASRHDAVHADALAAVGVPGELQINAAGGVAL